MLKVSRKIAKNWKGKLGNLSKKRKIQKSTTKTTEKSLTTQKIRMAMADLLIVLPRITKLTKKMKIVMVSFHSQIISLGMKIMLSMNLQMRKKLKEQKIHSLVFLPSQILKLDQFKTNINPSTICSKTSPNQAHILNLMNKMLNLTQSKNLKKQIKNQS